ncbi:type II secretory pathway protein [Paraburkholderia sp. GAS32]|uniref:type II secretory pathway protein n=1 Tax=Paraburkholderia sp. GAS32 TaxID=3035129 RepID=UPI003D1D3AC4
MKFQLSAIAGAAALCVLSGCVVSQGDINAAYNGADADGKAAMATSGRGIPLVEHVRTAYLGDSKIALAYDASLPPVFRTKKISMPANIDLKLMASVLSQQLGYPVQLTPDVFIPRESLVPQVGGSKGMSTKTYEIPVYDQSCVSCNGADYLRNMTDSLGLSWEFDGAKITVSRVVTRMYQIAAIPGTVSIESTSTKGTSTTTGNESAGSSGGTTTTNGNFSATTTSGRKGDFDQIKSITATLNQLTSPIGHVTVNPQSRLVMIYDTREAADRMAAVLQRENGIATRQVAMRVRTVEIALKNGSQAGVNADVVFNKIQNGLAQYAVSFTSPTSLATGGGSVGLSVLAANAPFSGTNAAINALNQYGKTISDTTVTKITLNGLPVSVANFQSDDYLRSTSPSAGALSGGSTIGLTPGTLTTGDFLHILPAVNDHNQIILSYWRDNSKLNGPFTTAGAGSGASAQSIQLTHTINSRDDETVALSDGQTIVLYGQEENTADSTTSGGIAGITGTWNKSRTFKVVMLTATVVPSM